VLKGALARDLREAAMAVMRWDPFSVLARMDSDFDDLVRRTWGPTGGATGYVPAVDLHAEGNDVVIHLELPGVDVASDVEIEVTPGRLAVSGERKTRSEREEGGESARVLVREMRHGSFRREFSLPEHVTAEDVDASYDNGVLTLRVSNVTRPKPEPVRIAVRHSAGRDDAVEVEASGDSGGSIEATEASTKDTEDSD
jgi:HSP20 family protein